MLPKNIHNINFRIAQIQTHSFCNAKCIMCPYEATRKVTEQGWMEWELFTKVIDDLIGYPSLKHIALMLQNEPLLDDRLFDEIMYIRARKPDIGVGLSTNGSCLNDRMLENLVEAGLSSLIFSINALTRNTFEKIELGLDFDDVMSNLKMLIEANPPTLNIRVKFMIIRENAIELSMPDKFSTLLETLKARGISFGIDPISNRAGSLDNYHDMLVFEHLQSSKNKSYCHDFFENVNVIHNGDVIICCADWLRKSVIGNLRKQTFEEIWNSPEAKDRRNKALNGQYNDMEPCKTCSQAWNIMSNLEKT